MNTCNCCKKFRAYYTKGCGCFLRENFGYCSEHQKVVAKQESCENWIRQCPRSRREKAIALQSLDNAIRDISAIKKILADED